jgi:hypothetical protein
MQEIMMRLYQFLKKLEKNYGWLDIQPYPDVSDDA